MRRRGRRRMNRNDNYPSFTLDFFNLRDIKLGSTILIVSKRGGGKTTLSLNILYHLSPYIRIPIVISGTADVSRSYNNIVPNILIHKNYNEEIINDVKNYQNIFKNKLLKKYKISDPEILQKLFEEKKLKEKSVAMVIMDDIMSDRKNWLNSEAFKSMLFEGRHFFMTNIFCLQDIKGLRPNLRNQIDYIMIVEEKNESRRKFIFEEFWDIKNGNYDVFKNYLDKATSNYKVLVIDNTNSTIKSSKRRKRKKIKSNLYYACPAEGLLVKSRMPKLGLKSLWKYNTKYYDHLWNDPIRKQKKFNILASPSTKRKRKKKKKKTIKEQIILKPINMGKRNYEKKDYNAIVNKKHYDE
jgi:hypothetical protein